MLLSINVLGPIEITCDRCSVKLAGQHQRALLAALVLERGKVVSAEKLVDVLWSSDPPASARIKIQTHVSQVRRLIGDTPRTPDSLLQTRQPGYLLNAEGADIDLAEFETLTTQAGTASGEGQYAAASELFAAALALWRGPAFADVRSSVIRAAATVFEQRRILAIEGKAEADLALGSSHTVVSSLSAAIGSYPFRERIRAMLMVALYRLGCRADALRVYRDGYEIMTTDMGMEPGPQLQSLHQRLLADDPALWTTEPGWQNFGMRA
jgi:DNA-binding SARP family transcriptional activator